VDSGSEPRQAAPGPAIGDSLRCLTLRGAGCRVGAHDRDRPVVSGRSYVQEVVYRVQAPFHLPTFFSIYTEQLDATARRILGPLGQGRAANPGWRA
jgi:hypothetical protein